MQGDTNKPTNWIHILLSLKQTHTHLPGAGRDRLGSGSGGSLSPALSRSGSSLNNLGGSSSSGLLVLLQLLNVSVEEQVDGDVPLVTGHRSAQAQHLTGKHPVHKTDRKSGLVVARDGAVNIGQGRVRVAQGNHGDIGVAGLLDALRVNAGVSHDQQTGLLEALGDVIGEGTGGEATRNALRASVLRVLQDGTLTVGTGRDAQNILGVLNGHNNSGSQSDLLPSAGKVDDVETIGSSLPDILLHLLLHIGGTKVATSGQHVLDIGLSAGQSFRHFTIQRN